MEDFINKPYVPYFDNDCKKLKGNNYTCLKSENMNTIRKNSSMIKMKPKNLKWQDSRMLKITLKCLKKNIKKSYK